MRRLTALAASLALVGAVAAAPAGDAARADFELALEIGEAATVDGAPVTGVNLGHFAGTEEGYPCDGGPASTCRTILVTVTNPYEEENAKKGRERATLGLVLTGEGAGDAALMVYESDADGSRGDQVASADSLGTGADEAAEVAVTTTEDAETRYFLVEVFFHAWAGTWSLDADFA